MGLISNLFGGAEATRALGDTVTGVAEVFTENRTRRMERGFDAQEAALAQHGVEFGAQRAGWFDRLVNGLNRLPRPMLALGTLGLFVYAMVDPIGFSRRMVGLEHVPEPLWWLLGAIVSFYFGAREMHHFRSPQRAQLAQPAPESHNMSAWRAALPPEPQAEPAEPNAALEAWAAEAPARQ